MASPHCHQIRPIFLKLAVFKTSHSLTPTDLSSLLSLCSPLQMLHFCQTRQFAILQLCLALFTFVYAGTYLKHIPDSPSTCQPVSFLPSLQDSASKPFLISEGLHWPCYCTNHNIITFFLSLVFYEFFASLL